MRRPYLALLALLATAAALLPPMHGLSHDSFAWHMGQHLALIFVVGPLIALALPTDLRLGRLLRSPAVVVVLHAVAVWSWHLPALYDAALDAAPLHVVEHAAFVGTALLFWLLVFGRPQPVDQLRRAAVVFVTGLQSAALGALLVFASTPLYDSHLETSSSHGLTPLEDQQFAGGIMWIPPGIVYLVITLALFAAWMDSSGRTDVSGTADGGGAS